MKTKNYFRISLLAASFAVLFACKKDNSQSSSNVSATTPASVQTAADDQTMVSNENDAVSNDATSALNGNVSIAGAALNGTDKSGGAVLGGNGVLGYSICDATVTYDTTSTTKTITIVYDGINCQGNRIRTGTVIIAVPRGQHWRDKGAVVNVTIDTLKITRVRDGKSIIINGTKTITNTSGGLMVDLATTDSIVHDFTDDMSITFDNGSMRTWQVSKHRVFTYNDGIVETTTGGSTGTNRFGVNFTNTITVPKVIAQSCDMRLVSGQDSITRTDNITSVITYGLDAEGNPITSCPNGYLYAKLVWTNGNNGKVYTYIYPY